MTDNTIKVKLLNRMADAGGNHPAGSVISLPYNEAVQLCDGGYASIVVEKKIETAIIPDQIIEKRKVINAKPRRKSRKKA